MTKTIDKSAADSFYREAQQLIKELAKKHGLQVKKSSGSYGEFTLRLSMDIIVPGENGTNPQEEKDFKLMARLYGLSAELLGKQVKKDGKQFTVVGAAPRQKKYPIIVATDGKRFKVSPEWLKSAEVR